METIPEQLSLISDFLIMRFKRKAVWSIIRSLVLGALVYFIWMEHNARIFSTRIRSHRQLATEIVQEVRAKIMSLPWKNSSTVDTVKQLWNID